MGDTDRVRIPNHDGVIDWEHICDKMPALGCNDVDELRHVVFVLQQIGLCLPLGPDGSSSEKKKYLFPCLLPAPKRKKIARWTKMAASSMSLGRRIACSAKFQAFPASFFPALQFAFGSARDLGVDHKSFVMYQGLIFLDLSSSSSALNAKLQAMIHLSPKHEHIDVVVRWPGYLNLKDEQRGAELFRWCLILCDKILALLNKYEGLKICLSALCPGCLHESSTTDASPPHALSLVLRKLKQQQRHNISARDWRYTASSWVVSKKHASPVAVHGLHSAPYEVLAQGYQKKFDAQKRLLVGSFDESRIVPFDVSQYPRPAGLSEEKFVFFLSHRGPDTKNSLVAPLSWILHKLNIAHFFDREMEVGKESVPQMAHAACACRVGVVIISHHFIESEWCLRELNTFLARRHAHPLEFDLFPVFYDSDLHQNAEYAYLKPFAACLHDSNQDALDFLEHKLLPMLLNFPPIQALPCIQSCQRKMASDPQFIRHLCEDYQRRRFQTSSSSTASCVVV